MVFERGVARGTYLEITLSSEELKEAYLERQRGKDIDWVVAYLQKNEKIVPKEGVRPSQIEDIADLVRILIDESPFIKAIEQEYLKQACFRIFKEVEEDHEHEGKDEGVSEGEQSYDTGHGGTMRDQSLFDGDS